MKSAVLLFAGLAAAQLGSLPTCARDCASEYLASDIGGCGSDPKCLCENQEFLGGIACCLVSSGSCDDADQSSAVSYASQICAAQGVTVPSAVSCSTTTDGTATATGSSNATITTGSATITTGSATITTGSASSAAATGASESTAWAPRQTAALGGVVGGVVAALLL